LKGLIVVLYYKGVNNRSRPVIFHRATHLKYKCMSSTQTCWIRISWSGIHAGTCFILCFVLFLALLGFQLRASCLSYKHRLICFHLFSGRVSTSSQLGSNCVPPTSTSHIAKITDMQPPCLAQESLFLRKSTNCSNSHSKLGSL
jgi:hypothetical protein